MPGCITIGGGGPTRGEAIHWARSTSAEILDAIDLDLSSAQRNESQGTCSSIDYATRTWATWKISVELPIEPADRAPLLDRVTEHFAPLRDWTVWGDDPDEVHPESEARFTRSLNYKPSIDDQGAHVSVAHDSRSVEVDVWSACYVID